MDERQSRPPHLQPVVSSVDDPPVPHHPPEIGHRPSAHDGDRDRWQRRQPAQGLADDERQDGRVRRFGQRGQRAVEIQDQEDSTGGREGSFHPGPSFPDGYHGVRFAAVPSGCPTAAVS